MNIEQASQLTQNQAIYDVDGKPFKYLGTTQDGNLLVECRSALDGTVILDRATCRKLTNNQSFPLNENELIHRVFGGTVIQLSSVTTINTGGYVMNDIYLTSKDRRIVVVHEYGAMLFDNIIQYDTGNDPIAEFNWDELIPTRQEIERVQR